MKKFISIIIPCYNTEKYIKKTIDSILMQNQKNIEIITVNDGSTDGTLKILRSIQDERLIVIDQENKGAPEARNRGLKEAKGDYIIFFDSDDYMMENALSTYMKSIEQNDCDLYLGSYYTVDECNNQILKRCLYHSEIIDNRIIKKCCRLSPLPINKVYRKSIIDKYNLKWKSVNIGQDLNFYLKYLSCCKSVYIIDNVIANYRIVYNGITRTISLKIFDIVNSLKDVCYFYKSKGLEETYKRYISPIVIQHYIFQMSKYRKFSKDKAKEVIYFFDKEIKLIEKKFSISFLKKWMEFKLRKNIYLRRIKKNEK